MARKWDLLVLRLPGSGWGPAVEDRFWHGGPAHYETTVPERVTLQ